MVGIKSKFLVLFFCTVELVHCYSLNFNMCPGKPECEPDQENTDVDLSENDQTNGFHLKREQKTNQASFRHSTIYTHFSAAQVLIRMLTSTAKWVSLIRCTHTRTHRIITCSNCKYTHSFSHTYRYFSLIMLLWDNNSPDWRSISSIVKLFDQKDFNEWNFSILDFCFIAQLSSYCRSYSYWWMTITIQYHLHCCHEEVLVLHGVSPETYMKRDTVYLKSLSESSHAKFWHKTTTKTTTTTWQLFLRLTKKQPDGHNAWTKPWNFSFLICDLFAECKSDIQ